MFTWDHRNRLTVVERFDNQDTLLVSVADVYDFANRLVKRTLTGDGAGKAPAVVENYVCDGDQIILRLDESEEVLNRYLKDPPLKTGLRKPLRVWPSSSLSLAVRKSAAANAAVKGRVGSRRRSPTPARP